LAMAAPKGPKSSPKCWGQQLPVQWTPAPGLRACGCARGGSPTPGLVRGVCAEGLGDLLVRDPIIGGGGFPNLPLRGGQGGVGGLRVRNAPEGVPEYTVGLTGVGWTMYRGSICTPGGGISHGSELGRTRGLGSLLGMGEGVVRTLTRGDAENPAPGGMARLGHRRCPRGVRGIMGCNRGRTRGHGVPPGV
jgi:hypothetical protein